MSRRRFSQKKFSIEELEIGQEEERRIEGAETSWIHRIGKHLRILAVALFCLWITSKAFQSTLVRYHDNAFITSRALQIVNGLNSSATYPLLEAFFKYQEQFYNAKTNNMSRAVVLEQVIRFTSRTLGNSIQSAIRSGFNDTKTNTKTRVPFKYGCMRGVYGTPFFFVNGFSLPFSDDAIDYNGWRKIIDPLTTKQHHGRTEYPLTVV